MNHDIVPHRTPRALARQGLTLPAIIDDAGEHAQRKFVEFFVARIRNKNTRAAYGRAVMQFFDWCDERGLALHDIEPIAVSAYIEAHPGSAPTVKQHLAAIRMLFDHLVVSQVVRFNPAHAVRGPRHVIKKGKTPVLTAEEARILFESIDTSTIVGLRDRAVIATLLYSFARVGAVVGMNLEDYYHMGKRSHLRLHEKGGKFHQVPVHHVLQGYLDAYISTADIASEPKSPLFRTVDRSRNLTANRMHRNDVLAMIKRRAARAGISTKISPHTFRATGITIYLDEGGDLETAQAIAAHESPRTTKLYDRTSDAIDLAEIERIRKRISKRLGIAWRYINMNVTFLIVGGGTSLCKPEATCLSFSTPERILFVRQTKSKVDSDGGRDELLTTKDDPSTRARKGILPTKQR